MTPRRALVVGLVLQASLWQAALAQSLAPAEYGGFIQGRGPGGDGFRAPVKLTIVKVDGDRFEGTVWMGIRSMLCEVPVRGRLVGDRLRVRAIDDQDKCLAVRWDLKVDGDQLEWNSPGGHVMRLSK